MGTHSKVIDNPSAETLMNFLKDSAEVKITKQELARLRRVEEAAISVTKAKTHIGVYEGLNKLKAALEEGV